MFWWLLFKWKEEVKGMPVPLDATCVWSNIRSDLVHNSRGNKRPKFTNTEEQSILPGAVWVEMNFWFLELSWSHRTDAASDCLLKVSPQGVTECFPLCSVPLQARHSVNPRFIVPGNSREVSWCPVVSMVLVRPGKRSSGGWELMISSRWGSFASIFTM